MLTWKKRFLEVTSCYCTPKHFNLSASNMFICIHLCLTTIPGRIQLYGVSSNNFTISPQNGDFLSLDTLLRVSEQGSTIFHLDPFSLALHLNSRVLICLSTTKQWEEAVLILQQSSTPSIFLNQKLFSVMEHMTLIYPYHNWPR